MLTTGTTGGIDSTVNTNYTDDSSSVVIIIAVVVALVVLAIVAAVIGIVLFRHKRRNNGHSAHNANSGSVSLTLQSKAFLKNIKVQELLGSGNFGKCDV
jgi:Na+/proline symporter